jgi:hypothetical protein
LVFSRGHFSWSVILSFSLAWSFFLAFVLVFCLGLLSWSFVGFLCFFFRSGSFVFIIGLGVLPWSFVSVVRLLLVCLGLLSSSWTSFLPCCFLFVFTLDLLTWSCCIGLFLSWSFVLSFSLVILLGLFYGLLYWFLSWSLILVFCLGLL